MILTVSAMWLPAAPLRDDIKYGHPPKGTLEVSGPTKNGRVPLRFELRPAFERGQQVKGLGDLAGSSTVKAHPLRTMFCLEKDQTSIII